MRSHLDCSCDVACSSTVFMKARLSKPCGVDCPALIILKADEAGVAAFDHATVASQSMYRLHT